MNNINPQQHSCWQCWWGVQISILQALCHDVIGIGIGICCDWFIIFPTYNRLKCHRSLPELSYSPELSSPSCTKGVWEPNQPDNTRLSILRQIETCLHLPQWTGSKFGVWKRPCIAFTKCCWLGVTSTVKWGQWYFAYINTSISTASQVKIAFYKRQTFKSSI